MLTNSAVSLPGIAHIYSCTLYIQPQHTTPDIFVWLLCNNKRIAYARVQARDLLYSSTQEARGIHCGKLLTLFLKVKSHFLNTFTSWDDWWRTFKKKSCIHAQPPGKRGAGLSVQAKLDVYLWFGKSSDSSHMLDNLPAGFSPNKMNSSASNPPSYLLNAGGAQTAAVLYLLYAEVGKLPKTCLLVVFRAAFVPAEVSHVSGPRSDRCRQQRPFWPFCKSDLYVPQPNNQRKCTQNSQPPKWFKVKPAVTITWPEAVNQLFFFF